MRRLTTPFEDIPVSMITTFSSSRADSAPFWRRLACFALVSGVLAACDNVTYDGVDKTIQTPTDRHAPDVNDPNRQTIFGASGINALFDETRAGDSLGKPDGRSPLRPGSHA